MIACIPRGALLAALLLTACAKDAPKDDASPPPAAPGAGLPTPTGTVHVIEMITDGEGSYFKPKEITAKPGDVLRFTLTSGVHNVHFLPDSNAGVAGLPAAASDMLQLPGQTIDVPVPAASGKTLFYQCDPHAALGMVGRVTVGD